MAPGRGLVGREEVILEQGIQSLVASLDCDSLPPQFPSQMYSSRSLQM